MGKQAVRAGKNRMIPVLVKGPISTKTIQRLLDSGRYPIFATSKSAR